MECDKVLKELGVEKIKFYYEKSKIVSNYYTVCILIDKNKNILSRGISICSLKDQHRKTIARNIALGRAKKALINNVTSEPLNSNRFSSEYLVRSFKDKDQKQLDPILNEADKHGFEFYKSLNSIDVVIPMNFPISLAEYVFKFKSEVHPTITPKETLVVNLSKSKEAVS